MKNKWFFLTAILLGGVPLPAQEAAAPAAGGGSILDWSMNNMVLVLGAAVIIGAFLVLYNVTNMLLQAQKIRILQDHGIEVLEKVAPQFDKPMWRRLYDKWTAAVPIEKEDEILIEHPHDGIYELDNSLPPWWLALFYITIAFGVVYIGYYHVLGYGNTQLEAFEQEMEQAEENVASFLATKADQVDENTVVLLTEDQEVAMGETIYKLNCQVCHGAFGEGGVGPNFTDQYWIHGGDIKDLFTTIKYGVPDKGMQSWQSLLRPADMQRVASFILTLQGTDPPNQKEAEGELYVPAEEEASEAPATADNLEAAEPEEGEAVEEE